MSDNSEKNMALLLQSETDFGLSILRQQNLTESLVFSPLSIALALALVHVAAHGETKDEIRNLIAKGAKNDEEVEQHFSQISEALAAAEKGTTVNVANHVFGKKDFKIKPEYLEKVKNLFKAGASSLDFEDKTGSANEINQFIEKNTGGHIKDLFKPDSITPDLVAVLVNALYFKADWASKFKPDATHELDFFTSDNDRRLIKFLGARNVHRQYAENEQFQVLSLPYKDETFSFHVFLPKARYGLQEALKTLDAETIQNLISNTSDAFLNVRIPKFKLEKELSMKEVLQSLGMKKAFSQSEADLTNFAANIYVSKVSHKAIIEVDEDGTKAAAATTVSFMTKSAQIFLKEPIEFMADHPFLFILAKDNHPLFVGIHN